MICILIERPHLQTFVKTLLLPLKTYSFAVRNLMFQTAYFAVLTKDSTFYAYVSGIVRYGKLIIVNMHGDIWP